MNSRRANAAPRIPLHRVHPAEALSGAPPEPAISDDQLAQIHRIVSRHTTADLSYLQPELVRQSVLRRIEFVNLGRAEEYIRYLGQHTQEADQLFTELLASPAGFFREPTTLDMLRIGMPGTPWDERVANEPFRAWVPCCSGGEEVYSVGITAIEMLDRAGSRPPIQIFGTDLNARALESARAAIYPESAVSGLRADRLSRFLTYERGHYRVRAELREICLFAQHNLVCDSPLSKMDLVVYRNQLGRVAPGVQMRILDLLHYSLKPGSVLVLGPSETGAAPELFTALPGKPGIYLRRELAHRTPLRHAISTQAPTELDGTPWQAQPPAPEAAPGSENRSSKIGHSQALLDELTHTIDALQLANEEIISSNEELQTTNQELMAAREELQTANQELAALNQEMESRNQTLSRTAAEVAALLRNVPVAIVTVDRDLRIRRCTTPGEKLFNIARNDTGRPITDLHPKLHVPDLEALLRQTIADLAFHERDVRTVDGALYRLSIRPYRSEDDRIEGALLTAWPL